ncbi:hypothetical protein Y032_0806g2444 [Ancylostoma ceylanicum]|nr:hypothetical protein Y032_0806g2444 [Ancylostoma ceylanicum]
MNLPLDALHHIRKIDFDLGVAFFIENGGRPATVRGNTICNREPHLGQPNNPDFVLSGDASHGRKNSKTATKPKFSIPPKQLSAQTSIFVTCTGDKKLWNGLRGIFL